MKNKTMITVICFLVAGLLLLKFFNFSLGSIVASLLPFIVLGCGIVGLLNGKKLIGSVLIIVGGFWGLSFLGKWLLLLIAAALIYIGVTTLKNNKKTYY